MFVVAICRVPNDRRIIPIEFVSMVICFGMARNQWANLVAEIRGPPVGARSCPTDYSEGTACLRAALKDKAKNGRLLSTVRRRQHSHCGWERSPFRPPARRTVHRGAELSWLATD